MPLTRRFAFASSVIQQAGAIALSFYDRRFDLIAERKGPHDLVSVADRAVERFIRTRLEEEYPSDGFLGEESGGLGGPACWVVDPIDGTNNFMRGVPIWGVSIAYALEAKPVIGLVYLPCLRLLYTAYAGRGAHCGERRLRMSEPADLSRAIVSVGQSAKGAADGPLRMLDIVSRGGGGFRSFGACIADMAFLADGAVDAFYHPQLQAWDYFASALLVEEAGGRTNAPFSADAFVRSSAVLAASPRLNAQLAAPIFSHTDEDNATVART